MKSFLLFLIIVFMAACGTVNTQKATVLIQHKLFGSL